MGKKTYMIEIDQDLWNLLKSRAEPLEDTAMSVLRRLLLDKDSSVPGRRRRPAEPPTGSAAMPELSRATPNALAEILEVVYLVVGSGYSRKEATHEVARRREITYQSVLDKYSRQLQLKTLQFERLLDRARLPELKNALLRRFDADHPTINAFFKSLGISGHD